MPEQMEFISALTGFKNWAIDIIPRAIALNRELRDEIRGIVGDLADDLTAGLSLVAIRLRSSRRIGDDGEYCDYLDQSRAAIHDSFREFRVCADIRNLEDRFNRFFDPARAAVDYGARHEVKALIAALENHERLIFDMIESNWRGIDSALHDGSPRQQIQQQVADTIDHCEQQADQVKSLARELLDKL